ncbi:MAG: xylosidase/arabinosidase [Fibrobacteres bacterium]|nr:xylosidase/arabinosidase [Fibrobacterota bacterium]
MPLALAVFIAHPAASAAGVDASSMNGKVLVGYQGWFDCPMGGAGSWIHWTRGGVPTAANLTVDMYPDLREFGGADLCASAGMTVGGKTAGFYSARTSAVVDAHFRWMEAYGIDGALVQRFVTEIASKRRGGDIVLKNVMRACAASGRAWAVEYDVSGAPDPGFAALIEEDWRYLVDSLGIGADPRYLHEGGQPVIAAWGMGFTDAHPPADPAAATAFIRWFHADADARYRAWFMGGAPAGWRRLEQDARTDSGWKAVYASMDAVQPWTVGRYVDIAGADGYRQNSLAPDLALAAADGNAYCPVIFPGFSWKNLNAGPANQIPRRGGRFLWRQAMNAKAAGAQSVKIAMFDEVDEGTAIFKLAPTRADAPDQGYWLTLDADGEALPSDWYLRLAGEIAKVFHGQAPMADSIPIKPTDPSPIHAPRVRAVPLRSAENGRAEFFDFLGRRWALPLQTEIESPR